jgi:lipopolysaccharide export system protein LptA
MNRSAAMMLSTIAACLTWAGGETARAQIAPASKAPVDITADQLVVQNHQCLATWSGNAEALQETSRLRANVMNVYNKLIPNPHPAAGADAAPTCGELDRMEADGNVYYVTPERVVKGDHAVYTADNTTITVTGTEVVATQGKNVISGTRMVMNTTTGEGTMIDEGHTGRGHTGRVRSVIYPGDQPPSQPGAAAPSAKPASAKGAKKTKATPKTPAQTAPGK